MLQTLFVCIKIYNESPANFFFLQIEQHVCQKIQNFMLISDLKEYFRKVHTAKTWDLKNVFSGDLEFCLKHFLGIIVFQCIFDAP